MTLTLRSAPNLRASVDFPLPGGPAMMTLFNGPPCNRPSQNLTPVCESVLDHVASLLSSTDTEIARFRRALTEYVRELGR